MIVRLSHTTVRQVFIFTEKRTKNSEINYKHAVTRNISKAVLENDGQVT